MLLDSAKDPLLFSVIHFKHPKQPHTVQVIYKLSALSIVILPTQNCHFYMWP